MPTVLGINRTQDASICLIRDGRIALAIQKERLTRRKHDWGALGDIRDIYSKTGAFAEPIDLVVECYSSDPEIQHLNEYRAELLETLRFRSEPNFALITHHIAHLYSAFHTSPFDSAAGMVIDSMGSPYGHICGAEDASDSGKTDVLPYWVEVASFYDIDRAKVICLDKQYWDLDRQSPKGLGCFYHYLTQAIFPGPGNDGKVMGLAAYGSNYTLDLPPLDISDFAVSIPDPWLEVFKDRKYLFREGQSFEHCAALATAGQQAFEIALVEIAVRLRGKTGKRNLCFAGGTALNCVANGRLLTEASFDRIFVPPAPHDGGTAVGCAVFGMLEMLKYPERLQWRSDFLGPDRFASIVRDRAASASEFRVEEPADLAQTVATLISQGCVVGVYSGRSEFGPRALGHRSLLADPRSAGIKDWINANVKGRELFRPLAPMVLESDLERFFELSGSYPFMNMGAKVRDTAKRLIPAVVHVDGSARIQTVSYEDDPFIYKVLEAFKSLTGIGVLLNTSFNGKDEPIIESEEEALKALEKFPIHALAAPPTLITRLGTTIPGPLQA